jgi:hypothetical protein
VHNIVMAEAQRQGTTARPTAKVTPVDFPLTDAGNGDRLVSMYGVDSDLFYCGERDRWII